MCEIGEVHQNDGRVMQVIKTFSSLKNNNVQAFINNIAAPKTLEELEYYIDEHGVFNVEDILIDKEIEWTVPRWAKMGDIVFFMHSKTARSSLTALRTALNNNRKTYTEHRYAEMMSWIERGLELHKQIGGKIYAVGRVASLPEIDNYFNVTLHYKSRNFALIDNLITLTSPIDISEFRDFIMVSRQSAITAVFGNEFYMLRELICSRNSIPKYYVESVSASLPLAKINENNWYTISNEYRHSFMLEIQFRTFYVDYLLKEISDIKTIYRECRCKKRDISDSFIDNVIKFNGKYLPVEVKLSIAVEKNIKLQLKKYCYDDEIFLEEGLRHKVLASSVYLNRVLVIDTNDIYIYKYEENELIKVRALDLIRNDDDFESLKKDILVLL